MVNIHDKAHELARAIKDSPDYKIYKAALLKIEQNPKNKEMIENYRKKQFELQALQMQGREPDAQKIKQLQGLYDIMMANSSIVEFLHAEGRFMQIMQDIYKVLGDTLELDNK